MHVPDQIRSEKLLLRRHRIEDLDSFVAFLTDLEMTRYMSFTPDQCSPEGGEQMLRWVIDAYESEQPVLSFTIADPSDDRYIGSCGLNPDGDGGFEIYYTVLPAEQRKGIATEATRTLLDYAIRELGTRRLVAYVVPENVASVRVAEKLGFKDDGPIVRRAGEAGMEHARMEGRRYILTVR